MTDTSVVDPKVTPPPVAPAATPPAVPAATPPVQATLPLTPAEPPKGAVNPNSPKWALDRISEESRAKTEARQEAAREKARADAAEELLRRMQTGTPNPPPAPTVVQPHVTQPAAQPRQAEIDAAAARQNFLADINDTVAKGLSQFGNDSFTGTVNTLTAVGATDEFLADVIAVDKANAHTLFQKIAAEPERAAALARMPSRQRIAEITRLSIAQGGTPNPQPNPQPNVAATEVSRAPAPPPPIQQGATQVTEKHWWDEDVDGADCDAIFFDQKRLEQRSGRARR